MSERYLIRIKSQEYEIKLAEHKLVNTRNPKDIRLIDTPEMFDHFKAVVRGY